MLACILFAGWGATGHRIINRKATLSFPQQMNPFLHWADSLARHASDADYRKEWDTTEDRRHYIDIDIYPEFITNGRIPHSLDSLIMLHGYDSVMSNGIVPFAIIAFSDSLESAFIARDWQKAMLFASDLGHYIGDMHQPLHITKNYNGQYTNQYGIHSRYETTLINRDSNFIIYTGDSIQYVSDITDYVFNTLYSNYPYVDSVLKADSIAHAVTGSTSSNAYYQLFWQLAGNFTIRLFKNASHKLATLIYTSWINAGSPIPVNINMTFENEPSDFQLFQNYPNPFNQLTIINYKIKIKSDVLLKVYDIRGREIATLVNEQLTPGIYEAKWNADGYPSGIYFYQLLSGEFKSSRRMILIQ